ncbi:uncharacterized protein LOC134284219 isoform X2 [Aedes albopictus]|uniref:HTH CENPB-type domain-containing protein n=1 Tax=Aedes albopictus TaxID=7160 RepID=A0ABM1YFI9_AEDAL
MDKEHLINDCSGGDITTTEPVVTTCSSTTSSLWNADIENMFAPSQHAEAESGSVEEKHLNHSNKQRTGRISKRKKLAPRKRSSYSESQLQCLLEYVRNGSMTMYKVQKYYGIPRATMQYRLGEQFKNKGRTGPDCILSAGEESTIVQWIQNMEKRGFPITRKALILKVTAYLRQHPRPNTSRNNVPGRRWFERFMRRHPQLTLRTPEAVSSASAKVSEQDIRSWFRTVENYLTENNLADILDDPSRILNGDETGFCMNASPKKVLATKGAKNVPWVETQNGKQNVTVLFSFAADGTVIPPDVVLPLKRLTVEIAQSFPADWGLGTSDSGWMNSYNFALYVKRVLHPSLVKRNVAFPVLYFVDGHKSHTALEVADVCSELGIILIALYPNATRILQPADVSIFRPLKCNWGRVVEIWRTEKMAEQLSIPTFGTLLQETMGHAFKSSTIMSAFRICGLYPFNADAVDYSKCIASSHCKLNTAEDTPNSTALPIAESLMTLVPSSAIANALNMIGEEKINLYKFGDQSSFSNEDRILSTVYNDILRIGQNTTEKEVENYEYEDPEIGAPSFVYDNECDLSESTSVLLDHETFLSEHPFSNDAIRDTDLVAVNAIDAGLSSEETITKPLDDLEVYSYGDSACDPNYLLSGNSSENDNQNTNEKSVYVDHTGPSSEESSSRKHAVPDNQVLFLDNDEELCDEPDFELIASFLEGDASWSPGWQPCREQLIPPVVTEVALSDALPASQFPDFATSEVPPISACNFFKAPPTPKRNPKHRNYKQKSYAILTAGERLQELRQQELSKAIAAKQKQERAVKRKENKLNKEAAAKARAEQKENLKKIKEKTATGINRDKPKQNAKKKREKESKKKTIEKTASKKRCNLLII